VVAWPGGMTSLPDRQLRKLPCSTRFPAATSLPDRQLRNEFNSGTSALWHVTAG